MALTPGREERTGTFNVAEQSPQVGTEKKSREAVKFTAGQADVAMKEHTNSSPRSASISDKAMSERPLDPSRPVFYPATFWDESIDKPYYSISRAELSEDERKIKDSEISSTEQVHRVAVKEGDSLTKIMVAVYGGFNEELLNTVLRLNPHIADPNLLFAGQTIDLPVLTAEAAY